MSKLKSNYFQKLFLLFTFCFLLLLTTLTADPTFFNSYPYQDLWPDYFYYTYHDGTSNVIPAVDGGFLLQSYVNPGYEFYSEPQSMFWKISENGVMEWRKQDINIFHTYFRSIVSNGEDRYYAMAGSGGTHSFAGELFILDEYCNVISTHNYWEEDSIKVKINSMHILDDGLIMAGRVELDGPDSYLLIKSGFNGDTLWTRDDRDFNVTVGYPMEFNTIIKTSDGGFFTCGHRTMSPGTGSIFKLNSEGDTLWTVVQDNMHYSSLLEYEQNVYYSFGFTADFYPGHGILMKYDNSGNLISEYSILTSIGDQNNSSRLLKTTDGNILVIYNAAEGEIHKVTPEGDLLWSRDHLGNGTKEYELPDWIGKNDKKGFQLDNGDYVYCGTTDRNSHYPEHVLLRVDEEGYFPVSEENNNQDTDCLITIYPNPFKKSTTILFIIQGPGEKAKLTVYNMKGQKIKTLLNGQFIKGGKHKIAWNGKNNQNKLVSSGVYLIKLQSEKKVIEKKVIKIGK